LLQAINRGGLSAAPEAPQEDMLTRQKCQFEPATLQATRPEYACFDPKVFRKHVHQEKRSLGKPILVKKKEDKGTRRTKKADSAKKDDECEASSSIPILARASKGYNHLLKKVPLISQIASIAILGVGPQFSFPFCFPVETAEGPGLMAG
jgi:hypothetical protein